MTDKDIWGAFGEVHAGESLKRRTYDNIVGAQRKKARPAYLRLAPVLAALMLVFFGSAYAAPVAYISIDVNPSIELEINRFDRVVGVTASNEDAEEIVESVKLRGRGYIDALEALAGSEAFESYRSSYTEITVLSDSAEDSGRMMEKISGCSFYGKNVACFSGNRELKKAAEELGISFGKYRAYLELLEIDPEITVEDIKSMPMSAIRGMIEDGGCGGNASGGCGGGNRYGRG